MNLQHTIFATLFIATSSLGNADPCSQANAGLRSRLGSLPNSCHSDLECENYYFWYGGCAAIAMSKKTIGALNKTEVPALEARAKAACPPAPACSPPPPAKCMGGRCVGL